jgi:DHA2 family lincomycin resistance protein-like MFS transporter
VFTLGLGAVPPRLYSHGSSILSTLQQVAAAFGTALVITVMGARAETLTATGVTETLATLGGMRLAFVIGAVLSVAVVVTALLLPARAAGAGEREETGVAGAGELEGTRSTSPA